ncbi:hypothetical protein SNEBB_004574 [Seison nebaliae]|nr:hypothetical protein SNEBB_004574 [Seison nebaliae]
MKKEEKKEDLREEEEKMNLRQKKNYFTIFLVVLLYWICSISMVFINKHLLSNTKDPLEAPIFITWSQCVISVLIYLVTDLLPKQRKILPAINFNWNEMYATLPLAFVFMGMISFNNFCLKFVHVSFYTVARSLTLIFNIILTYVILGEKTSLKTCGSAAVVISGFVLGINEENRLIDLNWIGVIFGICASLFVALNAIFMKRTIPKVQDSIWRTAYYLNLNSTIIFIPLITVLGEWPLIYHYKLLFSIKWICSMVVAGVLGFSMTAVSGLQIQYTSALTHNISGTAKACAQTVLAVIAFNESKNLLWWMSNLLILGGSSLYTHIRRMEMEEKKLPRTLGK